MLTTIQDEILLGYSFFETFIIENGLIINENLHFQRGYKTTTFFNIKNQEFILKWSELIEFIKINFAKDRKKGKAVFVPTKNGGLDMFLKVDEIPLYPNIIPLFFSELASRHSKDLFWRVKSGSWGRNLHFLREQTNFKNKVNTDSNPIGEFIDLDKSILEPIFINEKFEICETARFNIYIEKNGVLYTPPISSGVLAGVFRAYLIKNGKVIVKKIYKNEIDKNSNIWLSNAIMGLKKGVLIN
jgi:branched-subunit amino acid aminotransferase/4-amino-4-deoxychorismate lyase